MLREQCDINRLNLLLNSLMIWSKKSKHTVIHKHINYETLSLYRYGWFYINHYKYSISGWQLKDNLVTFENEDNHQKIKYAINENNVINVEFKKDNMYNSFIRKLKKLLSNKLRYLSDKLQS